MAVRTADRVYCLHDIAIGQIGIRIEEYNDFGSASTLGVEETRQICGRYAL